MKAADLATSCFTKHLWNEGNPCSAIDDIYRPSTHFPTILPGTPSAARSASRARSSRFGSLTCGTSRKIGTVVRPRPVLDRDATAQPLVFNRPSATSRLGPRLR